ncbi:FtsX-like permease family protein [Pigmentibacter sp. JX0631]|uniref:FtsX-like permease family protein n=1 Tax=Pigmentibacter sp. JX0631 TaxID=2976982 RepID=UPI002469A8DB|nr:FtsX-like permease family protein [Pigmentibacter sp. JX0631]WGL61156.1 FtsX-like permease family protein [Pigmentibacter sp. JX0631]
MQTKAKAIRFLLYRYLFSSWASRTRKNASSIGVLLPVTGVAIGVFAFTVVLSVMGGFVKDIKNNLFNLNAHIEIIAKNKNDLIPIDPLLLSKIESFSSDILSTAPYQSGDVILQAGNKGQMARLEGISPEKAPLTLGIEKYLSKNSSLDILNKKLKAQNIYKSADFPTIILSYDLMNQLGLNVGDSLTLVSTQPDEGPGGLSPIQFPVVIAANVNLKNLALNQKVIFSSIDVANIFFQTHNTWKGIQIKIKNPLDADDFSINLNKKLNPLGLQAIPWTESNSAFLKVLTLEKWGMSFVMSMIILVGCFSISISLLLSVRRKSSEFAILRSMGFEQLDLSRLLLWQGFIIGLAGVVIGLILGGLCLYFIHNYQIPFITHSYSSKPLPILVNYFDLIIISLGSVFLAMLAAVWPAIEVKNLDIIEILSVRN